MCANTVLCAFYFVAICVNCVPDCSAGCGVACACVLLINSVVVYICVRLLCGVLAVLCVGRLLDRVFLIGCVFVSSVPVFACVRMCVID